MKIFTKRKVSKFTPFKPGLKTVVILVAIFVTMQVAFALQQGAMGLKVSDYERQIAEITDDKNKLEGELVNTSSLRILNDQAENLGYQKINQMIYVKVGDSFASIIN